MAGRRERIVIPIHGNQPLKKGLLRSLMKMPGCTRKICRIMSERIRGVLAPVVTAETKN
jgi:hypothetical protein